MASEPSRKEPMLYGFPEWEVRSLADDIVRDRERQRTQPKLYAAALKLLKVRQKVVEGILSASKVKG